MHLIVVAVESGLADLRQLLESVRHQECPHPASGSGKARLTSITVACNEALARIRETADSFAAVDCVDGGGRGYGHAINVAAKHILSASNGDSSATPDERPRWLGVCNADLIFPPGSIDAMLAAIREAEADASAGPSGAESAMPIGCLAPRLLDPAERGGGLQPSLGTFPTLASLLVGKVGRSRALRKYTRQPETAADVAWATGACLLVRSEAFEAIGGFDAEFFLDYEDTDLAHRLHDAGWRVRYVPTWEVIHTSPNASRPPRLDRQLHTRASLMRYFAKHRPAWEFHVLGLLMALTAITAGWWHPMGRSWRHGARAWLRLTIRQ